MKKRFLTVAVILLALTASVAAYYRYRGAGAAGPDVTTATVGLGDVSQTVQATGTLEAVSTVQVGSQLSGRISELLADYNSVVRKGQVIARLDPSLFQAQVDQAKATLARVRAQVERARVQREDASRKLTRAKELATHQLIAASDLDAAQSTNDAADADWKSAQADVVQARAALSQAQVNLEHAVIQSPIDGIVISRSVDVGQTVAAAMQAPTLFVIANDLSRMQVNASIDEADIGVIRPGQPVRFKVDAFPDREFRGKVVQVRLQPTVVQNVTTYTTGDRGAERGPRAQARHDGVGHGRRRPPAARSPRLGGGASLHAHDRDVRPPRAAGAGGSGSGAADPRCRGHWRAAGSGAERRRGQPWRSGGLARRAVDRRRVCAARGAGAAGARVDHARRRASSPITIQIGLSDGVHVEVTGGAEAGTELVTGVTQASSTSASAAGGQARSPLLPQFPRRTAGGANRGR